MSELQLNLLDWTPPIPNLHFSGSTYDPGYDCERLTGQQRRVWEAVRGGRWYSLREIAKLTGDLEASISARLRLFNGHEYLAQFFVMSSRRRGDAKNGVWEYSVRLRAS
jgi:hypothetical protein